MRDAAYIMRDTEIEKEYNNYTKTISELEPEPGTAIIIYIGTKLQRYCWEKLIKGKALSDHQSLRINDQHL